jgi:hypothetical protein
MKTKVIAEYDKYEGVEKLMPYAKGVSAKTHVFDDKGNDMETDFTRMLKIIKESGFKGYIGIEYEGTFLKQMSGGKGNYLSEYEGIMATKRLLEKLAHPSLSWLLEHTSYSKILDNLCVAGTSSTCFKVLTIICIDAYLFTHQ